MKSDVIKNSVFYQTLITYKENMTEMNEYLGSPGLAMNVLHNSVERYIFCDIEDKSLEAITNYSRKCNLTNKV